MLQQAALCRKEPFLFGRVSDVFLFYFVSFFFFFCTLWGISANVCSAGMLLLPLEQNNNIIPIKRNESCATNVSWGHQFSPSFSVDLKRADIFLQWHLHGCSEIPKIPMLICWSRQALIKWWASSLESKAFLHLVFLLWRSFGSQTSAYLHRRAESTLGLQHDKRLVTLTVYFITEKTFLRIWKMQLIWSKAINKGLNDWTAATPVCRPALSRPTPVHGLCDKMFFPPTVRSVLPRLPSNRRHPRRRPSEQAAVEPHICTPLLAKHTLLWQNQSQSHMPR